MIHRLLVLLGVLMIGSAALAQVRTTADSQAPSAITRAEKTIIEFELLGQGALSGGVKAHRWAETLQKLGVSVRIRQPTADDEPGVSEKTRGTLRWVTVIGFLDNTGQMVLPDREYAVSDAALLKEWINELKLYGAQGAPEGKPVWGLSEVQFNMVFSALSKPIPQDTDGKTVADALEHMNLPEEYPIRFHSTAAKHMAELKSVLPVRQRLAGMSNGTGLAALLADYGLGFRPLRTPSGGIELVVQPLADISDPWPVGWDLKLEMRRNELAPELFKMVPVKFDDIPLQDVLDAIAQATGIPIVVDHYAAEKKGIDLTATTLSYPMKRTAWIMVINSVSARNRLSKKLLIDELGQPFVRVAPFVPRRQAD